MAIDQREENENGNIVDLEKPFLQPNRTHVNSKGDENGNIAMVLLSTAVAVCGAFEFGSCVSIKRVRLNLD